MHFDIRKIKHLTQVLNVTLLLDNAKNSPKLPATVGKIINGQYTTDYNKWCTANIIDYNNFKTIVDDAVNTCQARIEQLYGVTCVNYNIDFLYYPTESYYDSHIDGQYLENNTMTRGINRDITAVVYLNDDYSGGEIHFDFFDLSIKPKAGDILLYPATWKYLHGVNKVIGDRYAIVIWFQTSPEINTNELIKDLNVLNQLKQKL